MVGRKRRTAVAETEIEIPVDLAARIGRAEPRKEPAPVREPVRRRHDGPIETTRAQPSAARGTPTDERGRPLVIGGEEPHPEPLAAPVHVAERSGRPTMIGVDEQPAEALPQWELGEMSLVATPLATPDDWHHFELALRKVRGVSGLRTEYYRAGILKLRLRWTGAGRFAAAVTQVPGYRVGILGEDRTTVQVRVNRA